MVCQHLFGATTNALQFEDPGRAALQWTCSSLGPVKSTCAPATPQGGMTDVPRCVFMRNVSKTIPSKHSYPRLIPFGHRTQSPLTYLHFPPAPEAHHRALRNLQRYVGQGQCAERSPSQQVLVRSR